MLNQAELKRIWHYDSDTGMFTRLVKTARNAKVGNVANCHSKSYIVIKINKKSYMAHRLAWLYMTGEWPNKEIDHIDGVRDNNKWLNLRDVAPSLNQENRQFLNKNNTSGYAGVSWCKTAKKWQVSIKVNYKRIYFGYFDEVHEAGAYRLQKKRELHLGCTT